MSDPFTILGVDEDAGDEAVKSRYLALVRAFPPDRESEQFQRYRAAYEALSDERKRVAVRTLRSNGVALSRLRQASLGSGQPFSARATQATITALLKEGIGSVVSK